MASQLDNFYENSGSQVPSRFSRFLLANDARQDWAGFFGATGCFLGSMMAALALHTHWSTRTTEIVIGTGMLLYILAVPLISFLEYSRRWRYCFLGYALFPIVVGIEWLEMFVLI
jgi:hypothetical protein